VTVGSANISQRSMSVDSEINIAATGAEDVGRLRKRVFELHSDYTISGSGDRKEMQKVFSDWSAMMDANRLSMKDGGKLDGFVLPFEDHRATSTMHASVTIPSSKDMTFV
jgi:phospholipase D1/2